MRMNVREISLADRDRVRAWTAHEASLDECADGVITDDGESAVLWGDGMHPLTERWERQIVPLGERPIEDWHDLLKASLRSLPGDIGQVRVEIRRSAHEGALGEALRAAGFVDQILRIRKNIDVPEEPGLPSGVAIRLLTDGEEQFAVHCVCLAITQALDAPVPAAHVRQFTRNWLDEGWSSGTLRSYVVVAHGDLVAHALVSLDGTVGELVDLVVPDAHQRSNGWSRVLSAFVETRLACEGASQLGGTVVTPDGVRPDQLVASLSRSGWWIETVSMIRKSG
ncbi:hypothetical protein AB0K57_23530 [Streptomyces halstedii]|uniref:hypothetical protein n=1 Tax=Streptomyces halstedii TaxID=1944 RepID=UPI00345F8797